MGKMIRFYVLILAILIIAGGARAAEENTPEDLKAVEAASQEVKQEQKQEPEQPKLTLAEPVPDNKYIDPMRYTLGPDDVVQIDVMRHPEFSGIFPINLEGKIQLKYAGDIEVTGLTKKELEQKIKEVISTYVISPEVTVTVLEYKSKIIYVIGEVGRPGKYYIRSDAIPVREAVVEAGLPTLSAAMRRCRLVTPDKDGRAKTKTVDLYSVLYGGNLKHNIEMHPGDVLYVPATIMAKIIRVINPVTSAVGLASSGPDNVSTAKTAASTLAK